MKQWLIERYYPAFAAEWNAFNANARNSTFLTDRNYMDYHADRFDDHSLIARKGGRLLALLPAECSADGVLHSHRGLTYGGWILPPRHLDCGDFMELWDAMTDYCRRLGIVAVDYKPLPEIYAKAPSGEDIYALFRSDACLTECNVSAAIKLDANPGFNEMRLRHLRKCVATGAQIERVSSADGIRAFHAMLTECLDSRHGAVPVHSAQELLLLSSRFPRNIELWTAALNGEMHAGTLLYVSDKVVHCQYIATTQAGRDANLLTLLFAELIKRAGAGGFGPEVEYFDFGTSNEEHGRYLNKTLFRQKASMGASATPCLRFRLPL